MKNWFYNILFLAISSFLFATNDPYISICKVTPDGGMAYSQVTSIVEDDSGFIWFSTNNGIFSYNSINIKRYSHLQNDVSTIPTNRINKLYRDHTGKIWVATENGLCHYNIEKDNFTRYAIKDQFNNNIGNNITSLFQDQNNTFWFADENGFGILEPKKNIAFYKNIDNKSARVSCLNVDEKGNIWVFYNDGDIYYLPKGSNTFQFLTKGLRNLARSVLIDGDLIWIGYESRGLLCINMINGEQTHLINIENQTEHLQLPSNQVRSLLKDEKNRVWAATYKGIALIENFKVTHIIDQQKYSDLPNHSIWSLYKDSQKNIWMGSWMGGLAFHSDYNNSFIRYNQSTTKRTLNGNIVSSFTQVPNRNDILIGLDHGGLNSFNLKTNKFTSKPVTYNRKIIESIKSLAYDKYGTLWVGTYGDGLLYQRKGETGFKRLNLSFETGFQALDILATNDGIWVSDYPLGTFFYHFESKKITRYQHTPLNIKSISNNNIHHIIEDKNGDIWFATENGLNKLKKGTSEFVHYFHNKNNPNGVSNNSIYCILEDNEGFLWLGTNGTGLHKFNPKTEVFENFTIKNGLSGNEVFSILEDNNNNLWLTTENGLCKFNKQNNVAQSYITNNSLQSDLFYPISALYSTDGDLFFGGSNGLIRFSPSRIIKNPIPAKATITKVFINNKVVDYDKNHPLELHHTQNFIGFEFTSNNYINPKKNLFKYRLQGFSDQWIETDYDGKANFTNIPPDNYVFEVKTANNDGIWNETPSQIIINITPPIWLRWYAYLAYALGFIASIYFFRKQVINRQRLKSEIEMAKIQRDTEEQLHQTKLQFFTNISHEFRTPLTLIQGPVMRLLKSGNENEVANKQLMLIKNNTDRLLRLISQFLDFRRIDHGKLKLSPIHTDIISFSKNVFNCFEEHAKHRNFNFNFISDIPNLKMDFDTDKLDKVLVNLLSNAFKYSPDNGTVTLKIENNTKPLLTPHWNSHTIGEVIDSDFICISISDTGEGMSADKLPQIFERFFQIKTNLNQGTGIGLSLSTNYITMHHGQLTVSSAEGRGSIFCICLPQNQAKIFNDSSTETTNISPFEFTSESAAPVENSVKHTDANENQESLILIAEDNPELLDFLGESLQNHFRISKTKNGKEAYEQIHSLYPDLVISDIMMPEINGIELCSKIKTDIRTSHIPVILLTALDTVKDKITGIHSGADAYFAKPFNEELLIAQVNNLLNSRKSLRESFVKTQDTWENHDSIHNLDKKLVLKAINSIEQNITNPEFTVEDLAKSLHLSRTHLHRKLKSLTDQSATEFIRGIRLKHAIKLMKEGESTINEIGYAVGFNSHNYFTKAFKKQYGKTPTEFIKENFYSNRSLKN